MRRNNKTDIIVGKDVRNSGPRIFNALIKGLLSTGCNVIDIGMTATPIFYFAIHHYKKDGGIMITASHNPPNYNGFKMCKDIYALHGEEIFHLYEIIENEDFLNGTGQLTKLDVNKIYVDNITKNIEVDSDLKVVLDSGNGSASLIASELFESLGLDVIELFNEPDGTFPNHPADPTKKENVGELIKTVKNKNADLGIGFDGDVDRIGVVDEEGNLIYGDTLLGIYAKDIIKDNPGAEVVFEVKCSQGLVEYLENIGAKPVMWKAGHSLIKAKMKEDNALLGGEMSGHMFFKDRYEGFDDAFYAGLRIIEILSKYDKTMSELADEIPKYKSTPELRLNCGTDDNKFKLMKELEDYFKKNYEVIDVDGVRVLFENGWALVRSSNTQPVIVLRMEAKTEKSLKNIIKTIYNKLNQYEEIDTEKLKKYF